MDRYKVRANFNGSPSPTSTFQAKAPSHISLPPKSHIKELPPIPPSLHPPKLLPTPIEDAEISIFEAERYFNEVTTTTTTNNNNNNHNAFNKNTIIFNQTSFDTSTNPRDSSVSSADGYRNTRNRSFRATPTASSEASWNSQSGLLSNPPGSLGVNVRAFPLKENRRRLSSFSSSPRRRFFSQNCLCYGKKSVDVEDKYSEPKSPVQLRDIKKQIPPITQTVPVEKLKLSAGIWAKSINFSPEKRFPPEVSNRIINSGGFSFPILTKPTNTEQLEDPSRPSLEVFCPPEETTILRKSSEFHQDDMASDTSSDLFEIESFSTQMTSYRRRDSLDEFKLGGPFRKSLEEPALSEFNYAPSEVSVEWSVTTAEGGFDRSSVANFSSVSADYCDDVTFIRNEHERFGSAMVGASRKKGGLLSCRCEKAVSVGPDPVKIELEGRRIGEPNRMRRTVQSR